MINKTNIKYKMARTILKFLKFSPLGYIKHKINLFFIRVEFNCKCKIVSERTGMPFENIKNEAKLICMPRMLYRHGALDLIEEEDMELAKSRY